MQLVPLKLALFQTFSPISGCLIQWHSQPENWGVEKFGGPNNLILGE